MSFVRDLTKPYYGAVGGIPSLNFSDMQWVRYQNEAIADPYALLSEP
ncbi:MAG: hypothetical protein KIT56_06045 [Gammaproteobacteria bacterium]|nr:hypothetical protein [Gammaproteobacteria bacterium]MCW5583431.1 hypothetical protein [Gammaproteobacteria bacterium]